MPTDSQLLTDYVTRQSQPAFAELVNRYLGLVYASALRRVGGDAHLARDVAQQVFTALACDARRLGGRASLAGWLYTTTRNVSAKLVRGDRRRRAREQEAAYMESTSSSDVAGSAGWERVRPLLESALDSLSDVDREAVLLRYFERRSFGDIATMLRTTEDAARVRVARALDKLNAALSERGITSTAAALGTVLAASAAPVPPAGLATAVVGAVLTGGASVAGPAIGWFGLTKLELVIAAAAAIGGITIYSVREHRNEPVAHATAPADDHQAPAALRWTEHEQSSAAPATAVAQTALASAHGALTGTSTSRPSGPAASPASPVRPAGSALPHHEAPDPRETVSMKLPDADLDTVLRAYSVVAGVTVTPDPALGPVHSVNFVSLRTPKEELLAAMENALREQAGVVLERQPDGSLLARRAPTGSDR